MLTGAIGFWERCHYVSADFEKGNLFTFPQDLIENIHIYFFRIPRKIFPQTYSFLNQPVHNWNALICSFHIFEVVRIIQDASRNVNNIPEGYTRNSMLTNCEGYMMLVWLVKVQPGSTVHYSFSFFEKNWTTELIELVQWTTSSFWWTWRTELHLNELKVPSLVSIRSSDPD